MGYPYTPKGLERIEKLKGQFIKEVNPRRKNELRTQIDDAIYGLFENTEKSLGYKVTMDFKINFSEVFHEKGEHTLHSGNRGGFDVVIANPPYVRQEAIRPLKPHLAKVFGDFYCGTADIYTYFYKCGIDLLKPVGHLCYIAPNKFMRAGYGKNTRVLLAAQVTPKLVIDFGDLPIFDAITYPSILLIEKRKPEETEKTLAATFTVAEQLTRLDETLAAVGFPMPIASLKPDGWTLERPEVLKLMEKLRKAGKPLGEYVQGRFYRGILTGLNEAFVIDEATRKQLVAEDPQSAELIRPWLRGRDIYKWKAEWAGMYLIAIASSANREWPWSREESEAKARPLFAEAYPAIHQHLSQHESKLRERDDQGMFWWELRSCAYYEEFERPKIIYPDIAQSSKFSWDESKAFLGNTAYIIPTDEVWLVGLLNSDLIWWYYRNISSIIRGGFVRFIAQYMETIPIPVATDAQKAPIIKRTRAILADPDSADVPRLEAEINNLVHNLYGLNDKEIGLIEERSG